MEDWFWVRCNGQQHIIALLNGSLVALDHNMERERNLIELGGPTHPCMGLVHHWRIHPRSCHSLYHRSMGATRQVKDVKRVERVMRDNGGGPFDSTLASDRWKRTVPWVEGGDMHEYDLKVAKTIRLLLRHRCNYPVVRGHSWNLYIYSSWNHTQVYGACTFCSKGDVRYQLRLKPDWWDKVWKRGIAVVDGCLVLDFDEHFDCEHHPFERGTGDGVAIVLDKLPKEDRHLLLKTYQAELVTSKNVAGEMSKPFLLKRFDHEV